MLANITNFADIVAKKYWIDKHLEFTEFILYNKQALICKLLLTNKIYNNSIMVFL